MAKKASIVQRVTKRVTHGKTRNICWGGMAGEARRAKSRNAFLKLTQCRVPLALKKGCEKGGEGTIPNPENRGSKESGESRVLTY